MTMMAFPNFHVEVVNGDRLGCLSIPANQIADWLNFLVSPQYQVELIAVEQASDSLKVYFDASEGFYLYLDMRLHSEHTLQQVA
jgi:hypothetical protein